MNDLSRFEKLSVTTSLKQMFDEKNYFDICTIDTCLKITGIIPNKRDYDALHVLHCVHWDVMDKELRDMTFGVVMSMFQNGSGFNTEHIADDLFKTQAIGHVKAISQES